MWFWEGANPTPNAFSWMSDRERALLAKGGSVCVGAHTETGCCKCLTPKQILLGHLYGGDLHRAWLLAG